jgi:hypothetical protein
LVSNLTTMKIMRSPLVLAASSALACPMGSARI